MQTTVINNVKFYELVKKALTKYNVKVVEGNYKKDFDGNIANFFRSVNVVKINQNISIEEKVHWTFGLLINLYIKKSKTNITLNDMNYIGNQIDMKYIGYDDRGDVANDVEKCNKIVDGIDIILTRAKMALEEERV